MNPIDIINEEVSNFVLNESGIWYHGTPDVRDINKSGGFVSKTDTTDYVPDPQKWNQVQDALQTVRSQSGTNDEYFKLLNQAGKLRKNLTYKKPIFFTNNHRVASTYTNSARAFDYQNSEPKLLQAEINDNGKILRVPARGQRFRMINADIIKKAFIDAGIPEQEINKYFSMFPTHIRNGKMSAETIGIIAQLLGFDIVELAPIEGFKAPNFLVAKLYYKMLSYKFCQYEK